MTLTAFGLEVRLELPVPELVGINSPPRSADDPLTVELVAPEELDSRWSGPAAPKVSAAAAVECARWVVEQGRRGDLRMAHPLARFHLDSSARALACAPADAENPAWRRLLLDTALVTVSLARGHEALHASAVCVGDAAVAIVGPAGAGKTSLAGALLRRGASLLADDVVALRPDACAKVIAEPGPPVANLPASAPLEGIARPLCHLGDEIWVRVERWTDESVPLVLVVALERSAGIAQPVLREAPEPGVLLLAHALHSGSAPDRRRARFALLSELAATTPVAVLSAALDADLDELAAIVEDALVRC